MMGASDVPEFLYSGRVGEDQLVDRVCFPGRLSLDEACGCILLLSNEAESEAPDAGPPTVILITNPRLTLPIVVAEFFQLRPNVRIAETAPIGRNVTLGQNVTIDEYCVIRGNSSINGDAE